MVLDLYKANEYPVVAGNPDSRVALCTLWQDPSRLPAAVYERYALVGSLRSPFGINVLLYNLARNPWLTEVVAWGPDKLSNTNIGLIGKRTLFDLWQNGFDADGKVAGNGYALVPETDRETATTIIRHVRLSDASDTKTVPDAPGSRAAAYMEPVYFPEFQVSAPRVWPSEGLGVPVRRRTGAEAFLHLVDRVWKYGAENPIDTGGEAVRELRNPVVVVEAEDYDAIDVPDWLTAVPELGISRAALEGYARTQFVPDAYLKEIFPGVRKFERAAPGSYLYAELLYAFPRPAEVDSAVRLLHETAGYDAAVRYLRANSRVSEARVVEVVAQVGASDLPEGERLAVLLEAIIPPTNQVENIADRIRRKPDDLDKEAVLWDPRFHSLLESGRPCLMKLIVQPAGGEARRAGFLPQPRRIRGLVLQLLRHRHPVAGPCPGDRREAGTNRRRVRVGASLPAPLADDRAPTEGGAGGQAASVFRRRAGWRSPRQRHHHPGRRQDRHQVTVAGRQRRGVRAAGCERPRTSLPAEARRSFLSLRPRRVRGVRVGAGGGGSAPGHSVRAGKTAGVARSRVVRRWFAGARTEAIV